MPDTPAKFDAPPFLTRSEYPRAAAYPAAQMLAAHMGPNVLWLTEALSQVMDLRPGQRVLDLGCGKALSSIFLAKEFNVQVWAADLWIAPEENARRVRAAGLEAQVFPLRVEAHSLPFAPEFFDAVVSVDAYHYFGTDELYLGWHLLKHVRPGGQVGLVAPGLRQELVEVPEHLRPFWNWEFWTFHSPAWWRRHWEKTGLVKVEQADWVPGGWEAWLAWCDFTHQTGAENDTTEADMLRADGGRWLGFTRMAARKLSAEKG
jgi:cyclopropane fatty-acyl-phospholipid synthase-like methyltransferase